VVTGDSVVRLVIIDGTVVTVVAEVTVVQS
jgi:hypothetical protein